MSLPSPTPRNDELQLVDDSEFCESFKIIARDVPRVYAGSPRMDQVRLWMVEVLRSHARRDTELGYVQGMCFVAAGACVGCKDLLEADRRFRALMACLRPLYLPHFPAVVESVPLLEVLLRERVPGLLEHFAALSVELITVTISGWVSVLAKWLPLDSFLQMLPVIGREGLEGLLAATLSILECHKGVLLHCKDIEEVLGHFANLSWMQPPDNLVEQCLSLVPYVRHFLKDLGVVSSLGMGCPAASWN